mgnify:CR=1 FL=1
MEMNLDSKQNGQVKYYALLIIIGLLLIVLGFFADPESIISISYINELSKIMGTVILGIGVTGTVKSISEKRFSIDMMKLLENKLDQNNKYIDGILETHLSTSQHNLIIPDHFRRTIWFYHQTSVKINGQKKVVWASKKYDFSNCNLKRKLISQHEVKDPRSGSSPYLYSAELVLKRNRLVISTKNHSDESEASGIYIFDVPVLSARSFGFLIHMDWTGGSGLSKAMLCFDETLSKSNGGKLNDEQLSTIWDTEIGSKYRISIN